MACAVANKVLEIVAEPDMLDAVRDKGKKLKQGLEKINQRHKIFSEIRGEGLLLGCQMQKKYTDRARDLLTICTKHGLLILVAGANVLRIAPALTINEKEIAEGLKKLEAAVEEFVADS